MIILRNIVTATSILLVLLSTPTVVEGTNVCTEVCPLVDTTHTFWRWDHKEEDTTCWTSDRKCEDSKYNTNIYNVRRPQCISFCVCNIFGYNCDGCEHYQHEGSCGWSDGGCEKFGGTMEYTTGSKYLDPQPFCNGARRMLEDKEKEDVCADFHSFRSLSAEGKRNALADKYCVGEDQVVRPDIYKVLLSFVLSKFEGFVLSEAVSYIQNAGGIDKVLTCDLFNEAYFDASHLTLCENKHLKKGKKQKKTP